jgi:hypothetical protein
VNRIESHALELSSSSLQSIVIHRNVQFIDISAFRDVTWISISISISIEIEIEGKVEAAVGNERFVFKNDALIDIIHDELMCHFSNSSHIDIAADVQIFDESCLSKF